MRTATGLDRLLLVVALCACRSEVAPSGGSPSEGHDRGTGIAAVPLATTPTRVAPDAQSLVAAQYVLRAYLDASRESTWDLTTIDTLGACGDGGQPYFPTTLLAGYTLLPFESRGDTIVGRAEVVTVAEQFIDRRATNRFAARQRVRQDVLEWDVIPVDTDHWAVCNGLRFGYRGVDSLTTWSPAGASYATAKVLADSVRAVRR